MVVAILLNVIGFVSSLSAAISVVLGAFLYQKFHGKPNKGMILIVSATTVVMMIISILIIYLIVAAMAVEQAGMSMSAIEAFKYCMQLDEFSRYFYADLVLTLMFTALGVGYEIFVLAKKIKRKRNI